MFNHALLRVDELRYCLPQSLSWLGRYFLLRTSGYLPFMRKGCTADTVVPFKEAYLDKGQHWNKK